jgi:hypothetical protein
MSMINDSLNHYKPYKKHNAEMLKRYRSENGDSIRTYNIGVSCNDDSDCPSSNLCIESSCYNKCDHKGNDCPFWHTCRDDLHPDESVCGPYTEELAKAQMPTRNINPYGRQVVSSPPENKSIMDYLRSLFR